MAKSNRITIPMLRHVDEVIANAGSMQCKIYDGRYVANRPLPYTAGCILWRRIKLAWGVFTGRYDALKWEHQ